MLPTRKFLNFAIVMIAVSFNACADAQTAKKTIVAAVEMSEVQSTATFGPAVDVRHRKGGSRADGGARDVIDLVTFATEMGKKHFEVRFRNGAFESLAYPPHLSTGFPKGSWRKALSDVGLPAKGATLVGEALSVPTRKRLKISWVLMKDETTFGLLITR